LCFGLTSARFLSLLLLRFCLTSARFLSLALLRFRLLTPRLGSLPLRLTRVARRLVFGFGAPRVLRYTVASVSLGATAAVVIQWGRVGRVCKRGAGWCQSVR
jgi:hypothetical protein